MENKTCYNYFWIVFKLGTANMQKNGKFIFKLAKTLLYYYCFFVVFCFIVGIRVFIQSHEPWFYTISIINKKYSIFRGNYTLLIAEFFQFCQLTSTLVNISRASYGLVHLIYIRLSLWLIYSSPWTLHRLIIRNFSIDQISD